jgi:hypothetical protein
MSRIGLRTAPLAAKSRIKEREQSRKAGKGSKAPAMPEPF